jgi:hypothetical protein
MATTKYISMQLHDIKLVDISTCTSNNFVSSEVSAHNYRHRDSQ